MNKKIGVILALCVLFISIGFYLKKDFTLNDIGNIEPGVKVNTEKIIIYGAVPIDSVYVSNVKWFIKNRILYVNLSGYAVPFSKMEGEYFFEVQCKSNDYDKVVYYGLEKETDKVLYEKTNN